MWMKRKCEKKMKKRKIWLRVQKMRKGRKKVRMDINNY
jgi:hypothetical protein